jgi:hypothetical protein
MDKSLFAGTLIRGAFYVLRSPDGGREFAFQKDRSLVIDEYTAAYLRGITEDVTGETDYDTGRVEIISKPVFDIVEYTGDAPIGSVLEAEASVPRRARKEA